MSQDASIDPVMDPARYIEKVSLVTGETLDEPIQARQLLIGNHRDYHVVDVHARYMMSRVVRETGSEDEARRRMKEMRKLGRKASQVVAKAIGESDVSKVSKTLFGLKDKEYFFRYKKLSYEQESTEQAIATMQQMVAGRLSELREGNHLRLRVLLTGGTGFVGKEIIWQVAHDPDIEQMIIVIRPKTVRNRKTGEVVATLSAEQRGEKLLDLLWLSAAEVRSKFRFIRGDVEQENLGIGDEDLAMVRQKTTHVIHCAASVAFDDPYEKSFRANVTGTVNALRFSFGLQSQPQSPFVAHLGIETSYIHGRQVSEQAREDEIVFPRNFYNNYYELTKAMASIETERFILDKGLRVVQLCPAIVIGESRAGNNRGDTKVVNAPVNLFGRAEQAKQEVKKQGWISRSKGAILANMASVFPGDPSAQINLIPVDRVVTGIIAALKVPEAIGERVHLATDRRITSSQMVQIVNEELSANVKLAEPTLHRNVTLPAMTKVLKALKQDKVAGVLDKLGTIFGGYSEWGQPIHEVGNDVDILRLEEPRPDTEEAFRMLCRHNRFVQDYGKVKDDEEISRREKIWSEFVEDLDLRNGGEGTVAGMGAGDFRRELYDSIELKSFTRR